MGIMMCYRHEHENKIRSLARGLMAMFDRHDKRLLNAYRNRNTHTFADLSAFINTNRDGNTNPDANGVPDD